MTELSAIIPVRDGSATLAAQLDALLAQTWEAPWEILVADNGSTDSTRDLVESYIVRDPRVRLIDASARAGAGHARNVGVEHSRGTSVAFCDADDIVEPGWVAAMGDALREYGCVGGRLDVERLNAPWLRTAFYNEIPDRVESFAGVFPFAASANLGVRRSVFEEVGPFDDAYAPGEDLEFCLRAWVAGHEVVHAPDAVVNYRYRPTLKSLWQRSRDYAIASVHVARRLEQLGRERPARWRGLKNYVWLVRRLPSLRSQAGRARWVVVAGGKWGRIRGSFRFRHVYL